MLAIPCLHCGAPTLSADRFCCRGCAGAHALICALKLDNYYLQRVLDPALGLPRPDEEAQEQDLSPFVIEEGEGNFRLYLFVEGIHCASCVWLIEQALLRQPEVTGARVNMTTRRLALSWAGEKGAGSRLVHLVGRMGYRLKPFDPALLESHDREEDNFLLRCLAVAGFAAGNIMLLSVSLWASSTETMGAETRALLHWISGLIAMPTVVYGGRPFFRSAFNALRRGHANMDVPISLALALTVFVSLYETAIHGEHAYFDSVVMLLFFLLIGRYLDRRARSRARQAAAQMTTMFPHAATVIEGSRSRVIPGRDLRPGMILEVAAGERVAADGAIIQGKTEIDASLITGESLPAAADVGATVFAGTLNIGNPVRIKVAKAREDTLLSDIIRLMEKSEQKQSRYVRLADKVTRFYTPAVHLLAASTFAGWTLSGMPWPQALLVATTVLIITCPCALALAVPVVQVIASGRLFRQGIFLKSGDALERLSEATAAAFDKTGTLTLGRPELKNVGALSAQQYQLAASLAQKSRHPAAQAVRRRYQGPLLDLAVTEKPGYGLEAVHQGKKARLGNRFWCGVSCEVPPQAAHLAETWFSWGDQPPARLLLEDQLRPDATEVVAALRGFRIKPVLLSGDRGEIVRHVAAAAGIEDFSAGLDPAGKIAALQKLAAAGEKVFMVGDGLNDAPALIEAHVSMSPAAALDITQSAADIVFQGDRLAPVLEAWVVARQSQRLVKQNLLISVLYNVVAVPLAVMDHVTPLIAALAMSSSSLLVILNSFRGKK